ncbi:MAG TPA: hypothetical protein VMW38_13585 [Terriglobia bacterium]|nr:hypothetical protein [Terriglobia bacterium]
MPVEEVEELDKRAERDTPAQSDIPSDAKVNLVERPATELVKARLQAIHDGPVVGYSIVIDVCRRRYRERSRAPHPQVSSQPGTALQPTHTLVLHRGGSNVEQTPNR